MKRNTKIKLLSVLLVGIASFLVFSTAMAADYGLKDVAVKANVAEKDTPGNGTGLPIYIGNIVGTALSLVAILFLIFMVYGGYLWLVSRGNEEMSKKGTDTIFGAIIGIIIILGAYALTNFIFSTVKEAPVQKNMLEQPCPSGSVIICKDTKVGWLVGEGNPSITSGTRCCIENSICEVTSKFRILDENGYCKEK